MLKLLRTSNLTLLTLIKLDKRFDLTNIKTGNRIFSLTLLNTKVINLFTTSVVDFPERDISFIALKGLISYYWLKFEHFNFHNYSSAIKYCFQLLLRNRMYLRHMNKYLLRVLWTFHAGLSQICLPTVFRYNLIQPYRANRLRNRVTAFWLWLLTQTLYNLLVRITDPLWIYINRILGSQSAVLSWYFGQKNPVTWVWWRAVVQRLFLSARLRLNYVAFTVRCCLPSWCCGFVGVLDRTETEM